MGERMTKLTDETLSAWKMEAKISLGETAKDSQDYSHHEAILALVTELQERRKADSGEPIYQYRIRNGYNGQVTEWQTIRRDQVDFVLKAQPLNAEFQIIAAPQPALDSAPYKLP